MAANNTFNANVDSMFKGMDNFVTTKTVVGQAQVLGDVTIVPLADVSFGMGAGNAGGGLGGKITPSAVLVIAKDGSTKMIRMDEKQDMVSKLIDMAPGLISKFTKKDSAADAAAEAVADAARDAAEAAAKETADAILGGEQM
ncbi:MAG: sporulation protein [Lachnospiraceae bacterium]|nr:sporulation protein [Lachnospiraceae bacterium]